MKVAASGWRWALARLIFAVPVVAGITTLTFVLIHIAPGDPIYVLAGDGGSPAYYAEMRAKYGLDRSLVDQLARYVRAVSVGDLGYSFMFQSPVLRLLLDHVMASLVLGCTALVIGTLAGYAVGVTAAVAKSRLLDNGIRLAAATAYAAPVYWTGQVFIFIAAVTLGWLPVGGIASARESLTGLAWVADVGRHLLLPAVTLSLPLAAVVMQVTRASIIEGLGETYVRAMYARGLSQTRVVVRHVVPNALVPVTALVGQHAAEIVAGAALTEALFGWPGVGYLVLHASLHRDYPLVTGAFIAISSSVVLVNAFTDAIVAWLDPRIRLS
ncbi:MAG: ABC transporter permease [Acidobacteria bacterium]|nr:ABC transporter permease [Acidobacteriota bacterium]